MRTLLLWLVVNGMQRKNYQQVVLFDLCVLKLVPLYFVFFNFVLILYELIKHRTLTAVSLFTVVCTAALDGRYGHER